MIYTISPNPSLDYYMPLQRLHVGQMNRTAAARIVAGGKGINVSRVLKEFGSETKTIGFIAGFTGDRWLELVKQEAIDCDVIRLDEGETRINVKIEGIDETEINAAGPFITTEKLNLSLSFFDQISDGDSVCICGNGLPGMQDDAYLNFMKYISDKDIRVVVDACGELLREALVARPFLIKPNVEELKKTANTAIDNEEDIVECAERLIRMGAQNVLVSMGKDGAIYVGGDGTIIRAKAPKGRVVNTVGSGDTMVAAFLFAIDSGMEIKECVRFAVAAGSAAAFSQNLATKEKTYDILEKIEVEILK